MSSWTRPRAGSACLTLGLLLAFAAPQAHATSDFVTFESGQVRPIALSPSGQLLFATNTPDNRLEVFRVETSGLTHLTSISVGLEPVAVAARTNTEVWVVNHLSDSVSVVALDSGGTGGRVARTLLVGDEPRDIVFAGPGGNRAFITTAHRGQNIPFDPQITTASVPRADVWVFDAGNPGNSLTGTPLTVVSLFTDTPRALAVTPDGTRVYAAGFHTGNQTATVGEFFIPDGGELFGGLPAPNSNFQGIAAPETGLIAKYDQASGDWLDELGRSWNHAINFTLPDRDVFVIDATANPPAQLPDPDGFFAQVGTILFNMIVNPASGSVYVSNTEAFNEVRFAGPGNFADTTVRGHLHESRITVLGGGGVTSRHLNKHIDYSSCCAPTPNAESQKSLAFPTSMAITGDGATLYVAALGSSKVGIFDTAALEGDTFVPDASSHIEVTGGGPTGLALDEATGRLYVLTRFDNAISIIDTAEKSEIGHVSMFNPEPASVVAGRKFLYDARFSSSHGDSACASCHVFGDFDSLAWDLGNPDDPVLENPSDVVGPILFDVLPTPVHVDFHPMKGPMTTQSLRGMANHGPMHWRGDRTGGNEPGASNVQPDGGIFDEHTAFVKFNIAFPDLLGRDQEIPAGDMDAFTDFMLEVTYPPNPIRSLDNSLTADQQAGRDFFFGPPSLLGLNCVECHALDPMGNPGATAPGFFGTDGRSSFDFIPQIVKIPHLRNQYQKAGMFGVPAMPFILNPRDHEFMGDQVRGFGFTHDGSLDTVFRFQSLAGFNEGPGNPTGVPVSPEGDVLRRQLEAFQLAFDSNMAPIVGQQATLRTGNFAGVLPRIELFKDRHDAGECELVAKTSSGHAESGYLYVGDDTFIGNITGQIPVPELVLQLLALLGQEVTFTCVPPGSGFRIALDRDRDGALDGWEAIAGSDPADPSSTP